MSEPTAACNSMFEKPLHRWPYWLLRTIAVTFFWEIVRETDIQKLALAVLILDVKHSPFICTTFFKLYQMTNAL